MEILPKTKKLRLISDFYLGNIGGWEVCIKHNKSEWKLQSYKGTNRGYDMLCESINSDQE